MVQFNEEKSAERIKSLRKQDEEELVRILSEKYGVQYADLSQTAIDSDALKIVSEEEARSLDIAVFSRLNKQIKIAVFSPQKENVRNKVQELQDAGFKVGVYMVSRRSLEIAWEKYKELSFATKTKSGILEISNEDIEGSIKKVLDIEGARSLISEVLTLKKGSKISKIVETILAAALAVNASDVHIEPEEEKVRLRFRLDGILKDVINFDNETYELLLSRVKLLSSLKLNVQKDAQDGRFSIYINDSEIEIRSSVLPGAYGESIVLRILNPENLKASMNMLGMDEDLYNIVKKEISKPNGMILTTGPTGSGKTTTLYAFLNEVNNPDIKIITIEDPIEYHLSGVVQTQVDKKKEYNFSTGLRSALRQDPDIIMVGEIRDGDTAKIAINASLTGHLVFSTLHTNSASGTFARLIDLGVDPKSIGPAINIALAQRLVRKLDDRYKKKIPLEGRDKEVVLKVLSGIKDKSKIPQTDYVWIPELPSGSEETGYSDRVGIYEGILVDSAMEKLIANEPQESDIKELAKTQNIMTMAEDGIIKVLSGVTSLDELRRVVDLENL